MSDHKITECWNCKGKKTTELIAYRDNDTMTVTCSVCKGSGKLIQYRIWSDYLPYQG